MKRVIQVVVVLVAILLLVFAVQMAASESGEVVVLETTDGARTFETRVWVVDVDGAVYLRSGGEGQQWYRRLARNPSVVVTRDGESRRFTAVPEVARRERVNQLMATKYGWSDKVIGWMFSRADAIPIRLDEPR